jgi:glycosyltransferase involved in cell wall biosynthesis
MKRVAILTTHPVQYHAHWFSAIAREADIDLDVLYCHKAGDQEQAEAGFGVSFTWDVPLLEGYRHRFLCNVASPPGLGRFDGLDTPEVSGLVGHYDAVVVNGWHYKSAWQAILACYRKGVPVFARGDSHLLTPRSWIKRFVKEPVYRIFVPRFAGCLAAGRLSSEYFRHYGARNDRIFFVPHCVDERRYQIDRPGAERLRREWRMSRSIPEDSIVFIYSGKLIPVKRPLDFVKAIGKAAISNPRILGIMIGDGPLRPQCECLITATGAPVRLLGFVNQSQIAKAYVAGDGLVLTSETETWGVVVNEAMVSGLACFVSESVGSAPDLIREGETGSTFRSGDVDSLAAQLSTYASCSGRLAAMGEAARRLIARYSTEVAVAGLRHAIETAA